MKTFLDKTQLTDALKQRYAVKQFEKREIDSSELENTIKTILQLTPTSFGLQAYKFVIVKDKKTREELKMHSWGQNQVTDSDIYVVFTVPTDFDKSYIKKHMNNLQKIRWIDDEKKAWVIAFMENKILETWVELGITNPEEWLSKQVYIALWNLMTSLAVLWIDSCPIEWLDPRKYNKILWLNEKNLWAKVALAIWKRNTDDKYQYEKKVRFNFDELFETI